MTEVNPTVPFSILLVLWLVGCGQLPAEPSAIGDGPARQAYQISTPTVAAASTPSMAQAGGSGVPPSSGSSGDPIDYFHPRRLSDFESVPNPDGFARPYETANTALQEKFGRGVVVYSHSSARPIPSLPFENLIIPVRSRGFEIANTEYRIPSRVAVLLTEQRAYLLGPSDLNDFLRIHGNNIEIPGSGVPNEVFQFLALYGNDDERIIRGVWDIKPFLDEWKLEIDATKLAQIEIVKKGDPRLRPPDDQPQMLAIFNTFVVDESIDRRWPPFKAYLVITRYLATVGEKGEVTLTILEKNKYLMQKK